MATVPMCTQSTLGCLPTVREANNVRDAVPLHRIAEVRAQQGVSLRAISRRSGVDIQDLRQQDVDLRPKGTSDLHFKRYQLQQGG